MPALISIIAFFLSASSFGNKNSFNFFSMDSFSNFKSFNSTSELDSYWNKILLLNRIEVFAYKAQNTLKKPI